MLTPVLTRPGSRTRGLSIVELLVGVAVGLFLVGGTIKLVVDYLGSNRMLLLETRLNQELRAAADIVVRDLRRGSYWSNAASGVTWPAAMNPNRVITVSSVNGGDQPAYNYDGTGFTGFRLSAASAAASNAVQARVGGNWQDLTDRETMRVLEFSVTPYIQLVSLGAVCTPACIISNPACPYLRVRRYDIVIRGQAVAGGALVPNMVREIRESVRVRNDEIPLPTCP